jgi:hypothetical protein
MIFQIEIRKAIETNSSSLHTTWQKERKNKIVINADIFCQANLLLTRRSSWSLLIAICENEEGPLIRN